MHGHARFEGHLTRERYLRAGEPTVGILRTSFIIHAGVVTISSMGLSRAQAALRLFDRDFMGCMNNVIQWHSNKYIYWLVLFVGW